MFESVNVPKEKTYVYIMRMINPRTLSNILEIITSRAFDIGLNYPYCFQQFLTIFSAFMQTNQYFYSDSLLKETDCYHQALSVVSFISQAGSASGQCTIVLQEFPQLCDWLGLLSELDYGAAIDLQDIIGQ